MLVYPDLELGRRHVGRTGRLVERAIRWLPIGRDGIPHDAPARATAAIEVRVATATDRPALERVAALDERPPLTGQSVLVAHVGGSLWAALNLESDETVADPFVPSADATELLRVRARQLRAGSRSASPGIRQKPDRASATVGA